MADIRETVTTWLRDAHAMEAAAVDNLEKHIDTFDGYPHIAAKFREDLEATRRHVEDIEQSLDRLGEDRSAVKDMSMKLIGKMQPYLGSMSDDSVVKHLLAAQAYENFEVASYRSLSAAAEQIGDVEIKDVCERSLHQKKEMADWIEQQIPTVTRDYLSKLH